MKKHLLRVVSLLSVILLLGGVTAPLALAEDSYTLTVEGGTGGGEYAPGAVVAITPDSAPDGQVFCLWSASAGLIGNPYQPSLSFTMPASDATVTAHFTGKTGVVISNVSVADKEYDGQPVAPEGTPACSPAADIPAGDFVYTYTRPDGSGATATPPSAVGSYRLVVTISDTNANYFGTNGGVGFTISAASEPTDSPEPTDPALTGTATIAGNARFGETLSASFEGPDGATPHFTWRRGSGAAGDAALTPVTGAENSYVLAAEDVEATVYVEVSAEGYSGVVKSNLTAAIERAEYAGAAPAAPMLAQSSATEITLTAAAGMEYRRDDGAWQDAALFQGLEASKSYQFYQRVKQTGTHKASADSAAATFTTQSAPVRSITLAGDLSFGSTLAATLVNGASTDQISWSWLRGGTSVSSTNSYVPVAEDVGKTLTVEASVTGLTEPVRYTTGTILKAAYAGSLPAAPTAAGVTGTAVTLTAADGYEYSCGGTSWQTNPVFGDLQPDTEYRFYQRVRETDTHLCSAPGAELLLRTSKSLSGTVYISGDARYGKTLVASLSDTNNKGTLSFTWKRGAMSVGTGDSYIVQAVDIGNQLSVEITSSSEHGSVTRIIGTVQKAEYVGNTPAAPTRLARTSSSITLTPVSNCEYSRDGVNWQSDNRFRSLAANTTYSFYQRVKATTTVEPSLASAAARLATTASTVNGDGNTSTGSGTNTNDDDDDDEVDNTGASTVLYNLELTGDNTRVLSTTLSSLIKGNQTQDVSIKLDNASFTFFKGTMQAIPGQLWYDFGVKINSCIHEQAAQTAAGAHYVATIHFNYDGALPAKANIKLWLGAAHAGKTLYYYKLDPEAGTLSFMQAATSDTTGWVTVVQDSCSDYVFCDAEILSGTPSPTPVETPAPTLTPAIEPADAPTSPSGMSPWILALVICVGLLFIVGGIWLYIRNRE